MVECGNMETPPSRSNMTIWGIVELIVMGVIGLTCLFNLFDYVNRGIGGVWSIIGLVGNGLGLAGLVFICLGLYQSNSGHIKIGIICFLVSTLICCVCIVFSILNGEKLYFGMIVTLALYIFIAYVLWKQSSHL